MYPSTVSKLSTQMSYTGRSSDTFNMNRVSFAPTRNSGRMTRNRSLKSFKSFKVFSHCTIVEKYLHSKIRANRRESAAGVRRSHANAAGSILHVNPLLAHLQSVQLWIKIGLPKF